MADITKTVQDGLGLSAEYEPDGIIRPPISEGITLSLQIVPSGSQKIASESMTLTESVSPSGSKIYINDDNIFFSDRIPSTSGHLHDAGDDIAFYENHVDGADSSIVESEVVVLNSNPWDQSQTLTVISPTPSSFYPSFYSIPFICSTDDGAGGEIDPDSIIWISDLDGVFHRGNNFTYKGLSVGGHTISCMLKQNTLIYQELEISIIENETDDRVENLREE